MLLVDVDEVLELVDEDVEVLLDVVLVDVTV